MINQVNQLIINKQHIDDSFPLELSPSISQINGSIVKKQKQQQENVIIFTENTIENKIQQKQQEDGQQQKIKSLENCLENYQKQHIKLIDKRYHIQMKINQIKSIKKHNRMSQNLLTQGYQQYKNIIGSYEQESKVNQIYSQDLSNELSKLEGKRGKLRGEVGMRVQQKKLIKNINSCLSTDLEKVIKAIKQLKQFCNKYKKQQLK